MGRRQGAVEEPVAVGDVVVEVGVPVALPLGVADEAPVDVGDGVALGERDVTVAVVGDGGAVVVGDEELRVSVAAVVGVERMVVGCRTSFAGVGRMTK